MIRSSLPSVKNFPGRGTGGSGDLAVTESGDQDGSPWEPLFGGGPRLESKPVFWGGPGRSPGDYEMEDFGYHLNNSRKLRKCRNASFPRRRESRPPASFRVCWIPTPTMGEVGRWRQDGALKADPAFAGMTEGPPSLLRWYDFGTVEKRWGPFRGVEPRQPGWQLGQQLEQLPIRQPEQEQPRQPQQQPGLPPREHHPAAAKMARTNGPIHRFPCSATAGSPRRRGAAIRHRGAGGPLRSPWRAEPNQTRGAAVGKLRPGAPSPKRPRLPLLPCFGGGVLDCFVGSASSQ